jgi:hypothetical protein
MAHFAKVVDGKVTQVIVAEPEFFTTFVDSSPGEWIQTSYNTAGGKHSKGGTPFRGNYAGIGYTWDEDNNIFLPKKPYTSWVKDVATASWKSPIGDAPALTEEQKTAKSYYQWNEAGQSWDLKTIS